MNVSSECVDNFHYYNQLELLLLIRPPVYGSNGRSYKMLVMFFFISLFFFSPRVLGVPSTDRPETLPNGRNLA